MKVLIAGFEPFKKYKSNPAHRIALELHNTKISGAKIVGLSLPVSFKSLPATFAEAILLERPDILITLGLAFKGLDHFSIETVARRGIKPTFRDKFGKFPAFRQGVFYVVPRNRGPKLRVPTLPVQEIKKALEEGGFPVTFSKNAGGHMCEQALYLGAHLLPQVNPNGMSCHIHLPHDEKSAADVGSSEKMPYGKIREAVKLVIRVAIRAARRKGLKAQSVSQHA